MNRHLTRAKINRFRNFIQFRNILNSRIQKTLSGIKSFDQTFVILVATTIGITGGLIAGGFRSIIQMIREVFWGNGNLVDVVIAAPMYLKIIIPMFGMVVVAHFVNRLAPEAKGHGVPEVMGAIATKNGFIRMRVVLVKAFASAISIASGAAVGREGPIVQIGSAFGSSIGQIFRVSRRRMKTFVGCGAAAGIAATFNAPIAGAIFASEIILGDFSTAAIGPIVISSVFATVISRGMYGDYPAFVPPVYTLNSPWEIILYMILGIATGFASVIFVKSVYYFEDVFDNWNVSLTLKAICGGAVLGIMALFIPQVLGVGYESMDLVLSNKLPFLLIGILFIGKIFATSISLGSGASGGIFAPSLFMGSMLGSFLGKLFQSFFPATVTAPGAYALVAMAAMVAGATQAPVTAILIIFEMTSEYSIILPLMVSSIIAMVISTKLVDGNIYTLKLKRRGINVSGGRDVNILKRLDVKKIKQQRVEIVYADADLNQLLERMSRSDQHNFYVCDEKDHLKGLITSGMIKQYIDQIEGIPENILVTDICDPYNSTVTDDTPINHVLQLLLENDLNAVPVIDENNKITGQVIRNDIVREYQEMLIESNSASQIASALKFVHKYYHEKTEVMPGFLIARIDAPSEFVNQTLDRLNHRNRFKIDILLVRRETESGSADIMPTLKTKININDQLLIFGMKQDVEAICRLS